MQRIRQTPAAHNNPASKVQRPNQRQVDARNEKRSIPVPLDGEQLERVGGGYSSPKNGW